MRPMLALRSAAIVVAVALCTIGATLADKLRVVGLPPLPQGTVADGVDIIIRTRPQS